ncbi:hypothetical protein SETIT_9G216500v2 [Setaria italica]|uniref:F-box domain-containing protein n=1 Tax=Setaria italica TaxID=4555 RepID=A0A368SJ73_SETIT|nr:hypothetical protein SETIT_9G216500v2 [Setaria italica]
MEGSSEPTMKDGDIGAPALPTEVLTEIFARLPSKSVGRFRCVSHAWCDTLTSPYFVELHYRRANQLVHPRLLLTPLMPEKFPDGAAVPLTKPCCGLILIRCAHKGGYFVFNPSTGAVLPIPDIRAPLKRIFQSKPFEPHAPPLFLKVSYGLGYCTVRKEHKVVRLFSNAEGGNGMTPTSCNCEVFVLDKPAYWRPSAAQPPLCSAMEKDPAVFIHGHLHFICSDGGGMTTFNISDETFGSLSPPSEPEGEDPYHVCVLRDYNEARWETLFCIDRKDDNLPALGLFEENLLPMAQTIEEMVFSSPTTKAWSDILKWLPVCSVLELSLVCREWRAMIMTDRFIQSHPIHANLNKSPRIMFIMDPRFARPHPRRLPVLQGTSLPGGSPQSCLPN